MNKPQKWIIVAAATVLALWAAFVLEPAAAHADEASYINQVAAHGTPVTATTLTLGHQVCGDISAYGVAGIDADVKAAAEAGVSAHDAAVIIVTAVWELCPSNHAALNAWLYPTSQA